MSALSALSAYWPWIAGGALGWLVWTIVYVLRERATAARIAELQARLVLVEVALAQRVPRASDPSADRAELEFWTAELIRAADAGQWDTPRAQALRKRIARATGQPYTG